MSYADIAIDRYTNDSTAEFIHNSSDVISKWNVSEHFYSVLSETL